MRKFTYSLVFILLLGIAGYSNAVVLTTPSGAPIDTPSGDGTEIALATHIEHIHHTPWLHPVVKEDATAVDTLNGVVAVGSKTLILDDATGFSVGDSIDIRVGAVHRHMYREIVTIVTNTLTIDTGIDVAAPDGSTIQKVDTNMAVDGSVTPQIFSADPAIGETVDILRMLISISDATEPDDSKFGGAAALTNGVILRKNINSGTSYQTIATWKTNQDLKLDMFNVDYAQKAGGGNWGVNGRWTISESGAIINLDSNDSEIFEIVIQDDLTVLVNFKIRLQGHIEDEN